MKKNLLRIILFVLLLPSSSAWAQERIVTGKVVSKEDGTSLPGVSVVVKGTSNGTVTDADGKYSIGVPIDGSLVFSFIGLKSIEVLVTQGTTVFDVQMASDITQLGEIVVVGYGEQSTRNSVQSVSTVNSESFKNIPLIGPQALLQGQAAGVQVVNSTGVLGSSASVRIRGAASLSGGGNPLYVVDGVPLNDGANGAYSTQQGAGAALNPLIDINPNDIETFSVLKDASAVAIYGSRGANGVILIKTKKGASDSKTKISADYSTGWSDPTKVLSYMQAQDYKTFINAYATARGAATTAFTADEFDWTKAVLRTGRVNNYNLSARGGDKRTTFFVGGGYQAETGYTIGNDLKRLSGRFNIDHKISDKIKFNLNYALSNTTSDRIGTENSTFAPLTSSYLQSPAVVPTDASGAFVNTGFIANVLAIEALNDNKFIFFRQTGSFGITWDIINNLKFRTEFGIDRVQSEEKSRVVNVVTPGGSGQRFITQDNKWLTTNTLNYEKTFSQNHNFSALLGQSFETSDYNDITVAGTGFVSDVLRNVNSAATKTTTDATGTQWAITSFFGRVNYRFLDKYLFEATARRDGSSRFGVGSKYGTFWAISGGWVVSDESFFANIKAVDFLKLTASYGTSGNDRIGNFASQQLYAAGVGSDYAGSPGLIPSQVPNPKLSWEETAQLDIGISTQLFNKRVSVDVNYYEKNTSGLLLNNPLPLTTGFPSATVNLGEVSNKGWDIQIKSTNYTSGSFKWTTNFNIGFLKNEVKKLAPNKDPEGRDFLAGSAAQRAIVGQTANTFYLIRYSGIDPATGNAQWINRDGGLTSAPVANDRVVAGSAIPDFTGGITNTFNYKGFDLNIFFNYSVGNKVLIDGLRFTENLAGTFNKSNDLLNYWKQPGDVSFAPALTSSTAPIFNQLSTLQLLDGSYLRLKNVSFGYNVPKNLLGKSRFIDSFRIYIAATNFWTIAAKNFRGPDPEVSANGQSNLVLGESFFALPQSKSFQIGVNVGF
jgi:TonB-dependent starch-binding outer membrane protein SusC